MIPYPASFLLVPTSARYRPGAALVTWGDLELHRAEIPDRLPVWRIMSPAPAFDYRSWERPAPFASMPEPITLHRTTYAERERLRPIERRRRARRGRGRRQSTAVPMAREWRVEVFAPQEVTEGITRRMLAPLILAPALTVWRCPWWRRGADIWRRP